MQDAPTHVQVHCSIGFMRLQVTVIDWRVSFLVLIRQTYNVKKRKLGEGFFSSCRRHSALSGLAMLVLCCRRGTNWTVQDVRQVRGGRNVVMVFASFTVLLPGCVCRHSMEERGEKYWSTCPRRDGVGFTALRERPVSGFVCLCNGMIPGAIQSKCGLH